MASSRKCLLEDEIEQCLLGELTAADQSNCSADDDSSGTDDLTVVEVTGSECSDSEIDDVLLHPVRLLLRVQHLRGRAWRTM